MRPSGYAADVDDSRRFLRRCVDLDAILTVGDDAPEPCRLETLAIGGAYLIRPGLPLRTRGQLWFRVPTREEPIAVAVTVVGSDDHGAAIVFDPLDADQIWALRRFLTRPQTAPITHA